MVLGLFKKAQKFNVGLDIAQDGIRAVLLGKEDKSLCLKKFIFEPFDDGMIQNGLIADPKAFMECVKKLFEANGFEANFVNISLSGSIVFLKTVTMPDLPMEELKIIAAQEAPKHTPYSAEEINIDIEVLEYTKRIENSVKKVDIVLAVVQKNIIKSYVDLLQQAGLTVNAVDVSPFATIRTLAHSGYIDESDSVYVSVLMGYENTDINIISKGMPLFSNNVPVGKKNLVDALVSGLEIDKTEIENILSETVLAVHSSEPGVELSQSKASVIARGVFNTIANEVQKTIEFYCSQNTENVDIKRIILSGSGACLQNADKFFSSRFKVDTVLCNSLKRVKNNLNYQELIYPVNIPAFSTSVGLALKGVES